MRRPFVINSQPKSPILTFKSGDCFVSDRRQLLRWLLFRPRKPVHRKAYITMHPVSVPARNLQHRAHDTVVGVRELRGNVCELWRGRTLFFFSLLTRRLLLLPLLGPLAVGRLGLGRVRRCGPWVLGHLHVRGVVARAAHGCSWRSGGFGAELGGVDLRVVWCVPAVGVAHKRGWFEAEVVLVNDVLGVLRVEIANWRVPCN